MKNILIQFDTDPAPSVFDRVVAIDSGVDELFCYGSVAPETVTPLVHGAMFTRGPAELKHTAIFIGGGEIAAGEAVAAKVQQAFFGPMRVSVMLDPNGSNTTAAAAVRAAARHVDLSTARALVLGGSGPVGSRAALLLAAQGADVRLASRRLGRAVEAIHGLQRRVPLGRFTPCTLDQGAQALLAGVEVLIAAGAAGAELMAASDWQGAKSLRTAIDLNAVPPAGLAAIGPGDKARSVGEVLCYGALGVGGTKMKIHKAALQRLFTSNDLVLDAEEIYAIALEIQ